MSLGDGLRQLAICAAQVALLLVTASFCFDCIHWALHRLARSPSRLLQAVAGLHGAHHQFLDRELRFHDEQLWRNVWLHHVPELFTQLLVCAGFFLVFPPAPVAVAMAIFCFLFVLVIAQRGRDVHHRALEVVPAPLIHLRVNLPYHSLHHVFPDRYLGSIAPLFDWLFGTGCQLAGRRYAVTGASGAFGAPFKELLEAEGAARVTPLKFGADWTYGDYSKVEAVLAQTDVLVLAHGAKRERTMEANCDSFVELIERFRRATAGRRFPVEVWAVGSEIEAHPHFGNEELKVYSRSKRAYARHAWRYYRDPSFLYRHIVPSAFTSPMGPGLISGRTAARMAMFFIRRGARYVPVTYTGIALLNYFKFLLFGRSGTAATRAVRSRPS